MVRIAFETARAANPAARLVLNDFDLSADYEHLIEECLDAGIQIDAIGVQTHMHQGFWGEDAIGHPRSLRPLRPPVQMTETTLVSGRHHAARHRRPQRLPGRRLADTPEGEARQADEMVRHYRTVVAHPSVESIT